MNILLKLVWWLTDRRRLKWVAGLLVAGALVGGVLYAIHAVRVARANELTAKLQLATELKVGAGQTIRLALSRAHADSLEAYLALAKRLGGVPIGGGQIHVPPRDTTIVHDTVTTVIYADGSRTGTFRDSTFAGVITGTMTAPPYPAALGVTYHIDRPAFTPTFGLLKLANDSILATVIWEGEEAHIRAPFYTNPEPSFDRVAASLTGRMYSNFGVAAQAAVTVNINSRWGVQGGLEQQLQFRGKDIEGPHGFLGIVRTF